MALVDNTTLIVNCDTATNWPAGGGAPSVDAEILKEGVASLGYDVDIATAHIWYTLPGGTEDYTGRTIYMWMLCLTAPFLDTSANGGIGIAVADSGGNESYWFVGGEDSYPGGWKCFGASLDSTPQADNGTPADITDITQIGPRFKGLVKSKLSENCFWDYIRYGTSGTPVATISGGTTGAPLDWAAALTGDDAVTGGFVQPIGTSYLLNGPTQIGTGNTGEDTYFTDTGSIVFWEDAPVNSDHFNLTICAASDNNTEFVLGESVGGQGIGGNFITINNPLLTWDLFCDPDVDAFGLYGCTLNSGSMYLPSATTNKEILTTSFAGFYVISPSSVPIKFSNFVGSQIPSAGLVQMYTNHGMDNCNFINTLGALEFMESGAYPLSVMKFYDNTYDIWTEYATTAQATSGSNPGTTGTSTTGTVIIQNTVSLDIYNVYTGTEPTNYVRCYVEALSGGTASAGTVLLSDYADTADGGGRYKASTQFSFAGDQPVVVRARYAGFIPFVQNTSIGADGLSVQVTWVVDPFANV